jgi:RecB family endonuclease NucS
MLIELRKIATGWQFKSEANLEAFVYAHLPALLKLTPIQQQYSVNGQICDLLCIDEQRRLTVIELKNGEDRYIIQQLTRYYAALQTTRPFAEQIDYSQPIQLIAIAPSFHRDNYTDRQYSTLTVRLLQFTLSETEQGFFFRLMEVDGDFGTAIRVPTQAATPSELPSPPRLLLNWLNKVPSAQTALLQLRQRLLSFDQRMQEQTSTGCITYGRGQNKLCAEIRFDSQRNSPALFLWLPHRIRQLDAKTFTARMRIWLDGSTVTALGHVPKGMGRMVSFREWEAGTIRPLNKILPRYKDERERFFADARYRQSFITQNKFLCFSAHYRSGLALPFERYCKYTQQPALSNQLDALVDLALKTWLNRL